MNESFYLSTDVVKSARALLGKYLFTRIDGQVTCGMIVETEAYSEKERGSHAYNGKTSRNSIMYEAGGVIYVYLCYGIHHLVNIVTNGPGVAEAVLIRALEPVAGSEHMLRRMHAPSLRRITSGPGKLTKALGIDRTWNGKRLGDNDIWLEEGVRIGRSQIAASERIGIDYAGDDARLPWRFSIRDNPWVSKP